MKRNISVVIMDLDNTLYDWVDIWYRSFKSFLNVLVEQSGLPQERLEQEIRKIFQKYGTSEYSFVIQEIPSLKELHPNEDLVTKYDDAIHAYRKARSKIQLYPTVMETLHMLKERGCLTVVFTESQKYYTIMRMNQLKIEALIDFVFSPEDNVSPDISIPDVRQKYQDHYELKHAQYCPIRKGELKPDPKILLEIIGKVRAQQAQCIYIGDSLMKDIMMAQSAGVIDVFAKYGQAQNTSAYQLLRKVSHWTDEDVAREKAILETAGSVTPSITLDSCFGQILDLFNFTHFKGISNGSE